MNKNKLLSIAVLICKFLRILYITTFLMIAGVFIHFQINATPYDNLDPNFISFGNVNFKNENTSPNTFYNYLKTYKDVQKGKTLQDSEVFAISQLTYKSLYINFIKLSLILLLCFLSLKKFQNVIESVREIKTFRKQNISSFRKIGTYLFSLFLLTSYTSLGFQQGGISSFQLTFKYLILSLLAYILAEIFKEGNRLSEENKLTV